jgi:hypothetical protein
MDPNAIPVMVSSPVGAKDYVQMGAYAFQTLGVLVASGVAIWGIGSWRREFRGKRRIELAENVLARMYEARDAINSIRYPVFLAAEIAERQPMQGESFFQKEMRGRVCVVVSRHKHYRRLFNKLFSMRYRIMAVISKDAVKPIDDIRSIISEMEVAIEGLLGMCSSLPETEEALLKQQKESLGFYEKILGWMSRDEDSIKKRVESAVSQMEEICRPVIEGAVKGKAIRGGKTAGAAASQEKQRGVEGASRASPQINN